ncbi:MAG: tetratricopeptide repeat protein [Sandaracinaceae bacterium]
MRLSRAISGAAALALVACGGGEANRPATDERGEPITTAGGSSEVSERAQGVWTDALALFDAAEGEAGGWTEEACANALAKFREANQVQGGNFTEAIYMMGVVSGRCRNDDQALEFYRQALATNESYCGARVGVGLGDMRRGDMATARQQFERAVEDDNQCTSAYVNLAIIQRNQEGMAQEALNNLRRALAIESDYLPAFNQMALLYFEQAARNRQMLDLAEVVCRQAQLINSEYAPIYNTWGLINVRQGKIIEALRKFEYAYQLDDRFFEAYMNFGELTLSYRGYADAERVFSRAHELSPENYDAMIGLGMALRGLERFDEAEAKYNEAIQLDPQRPEAYYNLALLYHNYKGGEVPQLRRATEYFGQFLERARDRPDFADAVEGVERRCRKLTGRALRRRRRRNENASIWAGTCRPGRLQLIEETIATMEAMEEMLQEAGGGGDGGDAGGDG